MKEITLSMLNGACGNQVRIFRETFGKSARINITNARKARKAGLNIDWLWLFMSARARAEYDKVCTPARAEYDKVCTPARAEYDKVCDRARAEYDKVCDRARAEYDKVCDPALVAGLLKSEAAP